MATITQDLIIDLDSKRLVRSNNHLVGVRGMSFTEGNTYAGEITLIKSGAVYAGLISSVVIEVGNSQNDVALVRYDGTTKDYSLIFTGDLLRQYLYNEATKESVFSIGLTVDSLPYVIDSVSTVLIANPSDNTGGTSWDNVTGKPDTFTPSAHTQSLSSVDGLGEALNAKADASSLVDKVDKVSGKQLSTEDYSTAEKSKLSGIEAGAEVNDVSSVAGRRGAVILSASDVGINLGDIQTDIDSRAKVVTIEYADLYTLTGDDVKIGDVVVTNPVEEIHSLTLEFGGGNTGGYISFSVEKVADSMTISCPTAFGGGSLNDLLLMLQAGLGINSISSTIGDNTITIFYSEAIQIGAYPILTGVTIDNVSSVNTSDSTPRHILSVKDLSNLDNTDGYTDIDDYTLKTALSGKVDKVTGKGLSTNDYTTTEQTKLSGIEAGAQVNTITSVAGKTGAISLSASDLSDGGTAFPALAQATSNQAQRDVMSVPKISLEALSITKSGSWISPNYMLLASEDCLDAEGTFVSTKGKWIESCTYTEGLAPSMTPRITSLVFNDLVGVKGAFSPSSCGGITTLELPSLVVVGGAFTLNSFPSLTSLSVPNLKSVGGAFTPTTVASLSSMSFPSLEAVGSNFNPSTMGSLTTMSFPVLKTAYSFNPNSLAALTSLEFPALIYVGNFSPNNNAAVTTFDFPSLVYIGGNTTVGSMAALTTISLPSMIAYGGAVSFLTGMTTLANLSIGAIGTLKAINGNVTAGLNLNAASVNGILALLVSLDGTNGTTLWGTGRTLTINGGTNAAPTGQGLTDKATLVARGCTITTK